MSRRPREAWGPARRAAFAVVPAVLVMGTLLVLVRGGGGSTADTAQIRAALGTPASPLAVDRPVSTTSPTTSPTAATTAGVAVSGQGDAPSPTTTGSGPSPSTTPATPAGGTSTGATTVGATTVPDAEPTATGATSTPTSTSNATSTSTSSTTTSSTTSSTSTTTTTAAPPPAAPASGRLPSVEADMLPLTNQDRTGQGLGALARNACLDGVASGYARQMAGNGVLAHNPGAGPAVIGCRPGASWGDNVGTTGPCSAAVLEDAFMASPPHRHNILTPGFTQVGFGVWTDENGSCWMQVLFSS